MKAVSWVAGLAGILLAAYAVAGRYIGDPELYFGSQCAYPAGKVLLLANTLLLIGIFLALGSRARS